MQVNDSPTLFNLMLADLRQSTERSKQTFQELKQVVPDTDIRDAMQSGVLLADYILGKMDQCCEIADQQRPRVREGLDEAFVEDFRREVAQIHSPEARALFVLAKASQLIQLHMGIEPALVALADLAGHYHVGMLLDDCMEEKLAFAERNRRLIQERLRPKCAASSSMSLACERVVSINSDEEQGYAEPGRLSLALSR
jgi:hypothetical protein